MNFAKLAVLAAMTFGAAAPALAVDTWLFGYSPSDSQILTDGTSSIQAAQTGWFTADGVHNGGNTNYIVGSLGGVEYRNFFSFNVSGSFASAQLQIGNAPGSGSGGGFNPGAGSSVTWTLYDLGTTIDSSQDYNDISIFNDLGTGVVYGAVTVSGATSLVTVSLNSAGLSALNAAASGQGVFNVGGSLSLVPEPASWAMMIVGFGLVGATMRRRTAALAA